MDDTSLRLIEAKDQELALLYHQLANIGTLPGAGKSLGEMSQDERGDLKWSLSILKETITTLHASMALQDRYAELLKRGTFAGSRVDDDERELLDAVEMQRNEAKRVAARLLKQLEDAAARH